MPVGQRIKEIREARRVSQERLAKRLNMTRANVSKLEAGAKVDADLLPVIADELGVSTAAFFGDDEPAKIEPGAEWLARRSAELAVQEVRGTIRDEVRAALGEWGEQGAKGNKEAGIYEGSPEQAERAAQTAARDYIASLDWLSSEKRQTILEIMEGE